MEHYGEAMEYAEIATDSAGTAVEKYNAWLEGIEGKLNSLKTAFQTLAMTVLDSELITKAASFLTWLLEALTWIVDKLGGLNTVLYITAGLVLTIKLDSIVAIVMKLIGLIPSLISLIVTFTTTLKAAWGHGLTLGSTLSAAFNSIGISASAAQIAVGAFVAVLGIALIAVNAYNSAVQESINNSLNAANAANSEGKEYLDTAKSIKELVDEYEALAEANGGAFSGESAEKVRSIQDKITDLVGDQADNLDLVNGKLDEEIKKLLKVVELQGDSAKAKAVEQMTDAENAYRDKVDAFRYGVKDKYRIGGTGGTGPFTSDRGNYLDDVTKAFTSEYEVALEKHSDSTGNGTVFEHYFALQSKFENIEDFIAQYERIAAMKTALAAENGDSQLYDSAGIFLADFKDIYYAYKSGELLLEEANKAKNEVEDLFKEPENNGIVIALKSSYQVLEEVQDGYDGLASALTDVTSEGYLTADALATLFKLEKDNALAGLKLADILTQDANGYKLAGNALEQYVQALIAAYSAQWATADAFASETDKNNALSNLRTLQAVLATLAATQEESTDASKARREELEKEQDMYQDQLDKFEELINLRKDLLQTYKDELDYQKELEKRQRNVTSLQTKLAVARLDQSAAGQARVRELEAELKEAQEDLEDFTLEHAIDILSNQLESQYAEHEALIKSKLDEITDLLEGLDASPEVNITTDTSWVAGAISQISNLINIALGKGVADNSGGDGGTGTTGGAGGSSDTYDDWSDYWYSQNPGVYGPPPPMPDGWTSPATKTRWTSYQDAADAGYSNIRTRHEFARGGDDKAKYGTYQAYLDAMYQKYMGKAPVYHTGGIVGGVATLASTEEFAKLLKGEFVSTPVQMKRFMEETLPQIANYANSGGNEFNAPLIEIHCDNVTPEALPDIERVVNEAVREIKKQFDSGMSRTGYKRQTTKRLT